MIEVCSEGQTAACAVPGRLSRIGRLVGNTPMLAIECIWRGRRRVIYAKSEQLNMTGSIKDRMAFHILRDAIQSGALRPGDTIVEATSGNTDMPTWGKTFQDVSGNMNIAQGRMHALVNFLQESQAK